MKHFFLLCLSCILLSAAIAQQVPQGMQYQAIARNLKGDVLANEPISLQVSLVNQYSGSQAPYYTEVHNITTNQFGLFSLVIGEGTVVTGSFSAVPWSTQNIWLQVDLKNKNESKYTTISNSKLLTVPYAFHAETANSLTPQSITAANALASTAAAAANTSPCACQDGLAAVQLLYLGTSNVTVNIYKDQNLKADKLIQTITNVQNGATLTINALPRDPKLADKLFFQIGTNTTAIVEMPTNCNDLIVGETYGNFSVISRTDVKNGATCSVCDIKQNWKIGGNVVYSPCNWFGSASNSDLILITNNIPRVTITAEGNTVVANKLTVGNATTLNNTLSVTGVTTISNNTQSTSTTNGALTLAGGAGIGGNLNVGNATTLNNTLSVSGVTGISNATQSTTTTNGALTVTGGVGIGGNLNVGGSINSSGPTVMNGSLSIIKNDPGVIASFTNTNDGQGDGISIKLGRAVTEYSLPILPESTDASILQLISCGPSSGEKLNTLKDILLSDLESTGKVFAGIAVNAGNMIIDQINNGLSLPLKIGPYSTPQIHIWDATEIFGGITMPPGIPDIPSIGIPALNIPSVGVLPQLTVMPRLPNIPSIPGIPEIDIFSADFWSIPNLCLTDAPNSTPLNNNNEFIQFLDKNNVKMGEIRAESVSDWAKDNLDPIALFRLYGALTSSKVDKLHAQYHFKQEIFKTLKEYAHLGVQYHSGNGDYAEWLERSDKNELVTAGDIVGLKGGKLTKDLTNAEQVMAVSSNPIMLGNSPEPGKANFGNNIAFMGQVPVKILGPVVSGDYIIGQPKTPGYGIAKHPNDMTVEDYKMAVGRAWDTDANEGPKMVNTLVGIHNGNFINVIKDLKTRMDDSESRLQSIEAKLNMGTGNAASSASKKIKPKQKVTKGKLG